MENIYLKFSTKEDKDKWDEYIKETLNRKDIIRKSNKSKIVGNY